MFLRNFTLSHYEALQNMLFLLGENDEIIIVIIIIIIIIIIKAFIYAR